jgi:hypothetical protein
MRPYSKAVGAALIIKIYVSSPCQGKIQDPSRQILPFIQGMRTIAMTQSKIAQEARGPPANGPNAGPQRHPSALDLQPLNFKIHLSFGLLSTKWYKAVSRNNISRNTPINHTKSATPGNVTGDAERKKGGWWVPEESWGLP